jgi:Pentapeptide repeats (8 copies)
MASKFGLWWQKIRKALVIIAILAFLGGGLAWLILTGYRVTWTDFPTKTLWDWMQLLLVPLMLAIGGFWLNQIQKSRDERAIEQRDKTEHEIARDKQREDLLQTYLDRMSELLLEKQLHSPASPYEIRNVTRDEVRNVARVRTITVLFQLDARRIGYVFAFLREAGLMSTTSESIVSLKGANLTKINFSQARVEQADLSGADLSEADLSEAKVTEERLKQAVSLKGATMPDGSKHPS